MPDTVSYSIGNTVQTNNPCKRYCRIFCCLRKFLPLFLCPLRCPSGNLRSLVSAFSLFSAKLRAYVNNDHCSQSSGRIRGISKGITAKIFPDYALVAKVGMSVMVMLRYVDALAIWHIGTYSLIHQSVMGFAIGASSLRIY